MQVKREPAPKRSGDDTLAVAELTNLLDRIDIQFLPVGMAKIESPGSTEPEVVMRWALPPTAAESVRQLALLNTITVEAKPYHLSNEDHLTEISLDGARYWKVGPNVYPVPTKAHVSTILTNRVFDECEAKIPGTGPIIRKLYDQLREDAQADYFKRMKGGSSLNRVGATVEQIEQPLVAEALLRIFQRRLDDELRSIGADPMGASHCSEKQKWSDMTLKLSARLALLERTDNPPLPILESLKTDL